MEPLNADPLRCGPLVYPPTHLRSRMPLITPRAHARARGYVIGRGVYYILYIYYISARTFFYLSKYSLSNAHFSTGRLLFEFNRLQYTLAAPEVFVSSANPVILPSGYRVSIVRNTNIYQIETTPLRYCMLHACYRGVCARVIKRHVTTLTSASYCIENSTEFNFCATFSNLLWNAV